MNKERLNQAVNYETLLLASNGKDKFINALFSSHLDELSTFDLMDFSKFSRMLSISKEKLSNTYFKVRTAFEKLPSNYQIISSEDSEWPKQIDNFPYCPKFLYYIGDISLISRKIVSIIGTKSPNKDDKLLVRKTVDSFVKNEIIVASGLSLGIEGLASAESCTHFAPSIAVIGTSLENYYPKDHKKIQDYIASNGGLVITMIPPCSLPQSFKFNFLLRNRLLIGLSDAVLVINDCDSGGAVKMAEVSLQYNRKVFFYSSLLKNTKLMWPSRLKMFDNVYSVQYPGNLINRLIKNKKTDKKINKAKKEKSKKTVQLSLF